jgi:hypothetical protein
MKTGDALKASTRFPVNAITHIHTEYSNGSASKLDPMVRRAVCEALGPETIFKWGECFTTVEKLLALLKSPHRRRNPSIGIITITDHMNHRRHFFSDEVLRVAAREPRIAACAEVFCIDQDGDGLYRVAPEVLVYGDGNPVESEYGEYFGLSQTLLEKLFRTCRAKGSDRVQTSRVLDFCEENGIACCLAHPFDGHELSLEATFDLISRARLVETINGGFSAISARILEDFIAFQNRVVTGCRLSKEDALRYPVAQRLASRIMSEGRSVLHPWGGSDAHEHNFARVVVNYLSDKPNPSAGDLFRTMIETPVETLLSEGTFAVVGEPGTVVSGLTDIMRIVARNMWRNKRSIFNTPLRSWRIASTAVRVVQEELRHRHQRQSTLLHQVEHDFGFNKLLPPVVLSNEVHEPAQKSMKLVLS